MKPRIRIATNLNVGFLSAILFVFTLPCTHAQQVHASDPGYTINLNVAEVVLHATVRNHKGKGTPVAGLGKDDFQVFEDGVPQPIKYFSHEDIPVTVGLVIDNSGSMRP